MLEIYSLGDSKLMFETLMALQMMFSSDNYMGIIKTALIIGMLFATLGAAFGGSPWAAGESIMKGGLSVGPWSMIMPVTLATIMTVPTYDFMVSDAYDGAMAYPPVTLPAVVGMPMAITSQVGKLISEEFEQAFGSVVDSERMTKAGFLNSIFVNDSLRDLNLKRVPAGYNNLDYDLDRSIQRYYIDCLTIELESIFPPPKITYQALNASSDLIGMFSYGAFANIDTVMSLTKTGTGSSGGSGSSDVVMTCGQAYALLVTELADTNIEATFGDSIKNIVFRKPLPGTATSALQNTLDAVAPGAITAGRMMTNRVMAHALQQAHVKHASLMGGNGAGMASVLINSEMVKNAKFITEKLLFDRYVRPFMTFVEIFALAMSPLIPFFVLIGSLKALTGWLMMTAWIALWAPILTIINYFILYKVRGELTAYTDGLTANGVYVTDYFTTINGYAYFAGVTNEWLALGSMLASTTPALAMGILTGTMAGLSGAAGAMSKSEQGTNFTGVAPTPIDGAALHRAEPSKIHNETLGSARSGFFEQSAKMNFGESFGNSAGRAREASSTANENLSKATANLLKAGLGSQDGKTFLSDVGGEVKQSTSRSFGASKKYAEAFENSKSIGADYKKEVAALAALSATAGGRFNMLGFKACFVPIMRLYRNAERNGLVGALVRKADCQRGFAVFVNDFMTADCFDFHLFAY